MATQQSSYDKLLGLTEKKRKRETANAFGNTQLTIPNILIQQEKKTFTNTIGHFQNHVPQKMTHIPRLHFTELIKLPRLSFSSDPAIY